MAAKIHLANAFGGRSVCRYSSRPSRTVVTKPLEDFLRLPEAARCAECARIAAERMRKVSEYVPPPEPVQHREPPRDVAVEHAYGSSFRLSQPVRVF